MRNVLAATSARACCRIRTLDLPAHSYNAQACLHPRWLELQLPSSGSTCTVAAIRFQSAMYQPCPCCASKSANRARIATDMSLPLLPRRAAKQRLLRPTTVCAANGNRRRQPCLHHSWPKRGTGAAGADPHTAVHRAGGRSSKVPSCCAAVGAQRLEPGCGFRGKGRPSPA